MMELLRPMLDSVLNPVRDMISRMARSAVELALVGIFALLCLGFLIGALHTWLAQNYGSLTATLILAGVFFALAVIMLIVWYASTSADRKKAEEEARRKRDERLRSASRGPGTLGSLMNLYGLASMLYAKRKESKERKLEKRLARQERSATRAVSDEARRLALTTEAKAREATAASRGYVRSAMDGVGPLTVVGTAAVGGLLTVLMMRRRRRR